MEKKEYKTEVSYIGNPKDGTVIFVTAKVAHLIEKMREIKNCLVFAQNGISIPEDIWEENEFHFSDNPQKEYAEYVSMLAEKKQMKERKRKYTFTEGGYYLGENVIQGENVHIAPGCVIGHDVVMGNNVCIGMGAVIKNAVIGDNAIINENAVVGAEGFTMAEDEDGNKMRIPTLGKVLIGNHVEIGALNNISCGSAGDTVIEDYVKIDALVHIGHDVHLHKNVEITAGVVIGGFTELKEKAYMGIRSVVRNRRVIGENAFVGMGAVVTKSVSENVTVAGNPARVFEKG